LAALSVATDWQWTRATAAGVAASAAVAYAVVTQSLVRSTRTQARIAADAARLAERNAEQQLEAARQTLDSTLRAQADARAPSAVVKSVSPEVELIGDKVKTLVDPWAELGLADMEYAVDSVRIRVKAKVHVYGDEPMWCLAESDLSPFNIEPRFSRSGAVIFGEDTVLIWVRLQRADWLARFRQGGWNGDPSEGWKLPQLRLRFTSLDGTVTDHHHVNVTATPGLRGEFGKETFDRRRVKATFEYPHPPERHYDLDLPN
jgi:hypothetical protein